MGLREEQERSPSLTTEKLTGKPRKAPWTVGSARPDVPSMKSVGRGEAVEAFEEIMAENSSNVMKDANLHTQGKQTPNRMNQKQINTTTHTFISKLVETKVKDRVAKARETAHYPQGSPVGETADFPPCTMAAGRKWHRISPRPQNEVLTEFSSRWEEGRQRHLQRKEAERICH